MSFFAYFPISKQQLERVWLLSKIDYKIRFYENKLGMAWAMVKPLSEMIIYYVVFNVFLHRNIPGYHLYLFLGLIFWNIFQENTSQKIGFLRDKKYLYEYSNMNKWEIYSSSILSSFIGLLFNMAVFFIISVLDMLFFSRGFYVSWHVVLLPFFFVGTYFICLAFCVLLSSVFIVVRDIHQIWQVLFQVLFWVSPVVYDYDKILPQYKYIATFLHPMAAVIMGVRNILHDHRVPDFILWMAILVNILFYTLIAVFFYNKYGKLAAERL